MRARARKMLRSCKLTSSRAPTNQRTFPTLLSHRSHTRFHVCKPLSSASQQDVQLRIDHPDAPGNVNISSRQDVVGNDKLDGSFLKDKPAALPPPAKSSSQKHADNLHSGQPGDADYLSDGELRFSRLPDLPYSGDETEPPIDDEPLEPITRISVPRQKYIPVSKVSLVRALADSFNDEKKSSSFLMICSLLDFILHAEHKTTLEQMRLDYKITRSALKKEVHDAKGKPIGRRTSKKKKRMLGRLWELLNRRKSENKVVKALSASMRKQLTNTTLDQVNNRLLGSGPEPQLLKENKVDQGGMSSSSTENGTLSSNPGTIANMPMFPSADARIRNSILAAARFQHTFLKLLKNAHFQGLSARDLQLTSALNTDYLLTLPIEVDWKHTSSEVAIIFRHAAQLPDLKVTTSVVNVSAVKQLF
ncbi:hypothetical protein L7F22_057873 [Adiantum nelumboides]|nr:hypothetical protein [Adiantum nelumboides]